jgi:hypothetical protein
VDTVEVVVDIEAVAAAGTVEAAGGTALVAVDTADILLADIFDLPFEKVLYLSREPLPRGTQEIL